ncbi:glycosyltransferase [Gluconacetobacter aggeris]|uniref:Glycosyltransferase n=1 Tax=Gluconacetobacter aggeris TaxID=1286186 RepID=A0A7W4ITZ4_9PROT|nr:glycosyltransferase family 2 protein [Gluconacetobacter aggeris]MBB2168952.1 glycosyltransferase [Gluconacetobacter aggeris]
MCNISFIITTFNSENHIRTTVNNIKCQSGCALYRNDVEVLFIDDGSSDATPNILRDSFLDYDNVRIIRNDQNQGAGYSRNIGLEHASGRYVLFLDCDDIYHPDMFDLCARLASCIDIDILFYKSVRVDLRINIESGVHYPIFDKFKAGEIFSACDIREHVLNSATWWSWDRLIRREFINGQNIRFQEIRSSEDLFFNASLFMLADKISYIDNFLIHHVDNRSGSVSNSREKSFDCCILAVEKVKEFLLEKNLYFSRRVDFFDYIIGFLNWHLESINGNAYFPLFDMVKKYLLENIDGLDGIRPENRETYALISKTQSFEYLSYLKSKFYLEREVYKITNEYLRKNLKGENG